MRVFFVRHAETLASKSGRDRTSASPISDRGVKQAGNVAKRLSGVGVHRVYSSTYLRAMQTAEIISQEVQTPVEGWDSLIEANAQRESFDVLNQRAADILEQLVGRRADQIIVCVSHATMIETLIAKMVFGNALTGEILATVRKHFGTTNTGMSICDYTEEDGWILQTFNDTSHL